MFESKINKGRANGYAPLDSGSKVPLSYLPPIQSTIDTGSFATTSSLQTFSESIDVRVTDLESWSSSLTDTFATDLEVSIVSSSVAATIAVVSSAVGLVTTSSFNEYTASQSTASLATTGSNEFNGDQTINGIIQGTGSLYLKADSNDNRYFEIYNTSPSDTHIKSNGGISFFGDDTNYVKIDDSTGDVTISAFSDIILDPDDGGVYIGSYSSDNGVITNGYLNAIIGDTDIINGGTGYSITDVIGRIPIVDSGSFATTGSNSFNGNQQITGSLSINVSTGIPSGVSNWNGQGGWNQGFYSAIIASGGTGTGLTVDVAAAGGGYISIEQITINTPGSGYTNGDIITIDNENNLPGEFTLIVGANNFEFNTSGSLVFPDSTIQTTAFNSTLFATTGSNTFNGNQIISGSLTIASGSSIYGIQQLSGAILLQPVEDPDPLSQTTTGTHLFVSSSNNQTGEDLYFRQADNKVKWKWVEGKLNTGILSGGSISYSGSLVYVKAGTGIILSHNASLNEEISVTTNYVHWNDYTASCQNITSSLVTYLYVDGNGTIHQTDTYFTPTQYRTTIPIGMVNHTGKNVITSVANNVSTAYDDVSQTSDFIRAFGPMKLKGLSMTAATNSLKFTIEAGTSYILGGFYQQDPNNSSYKETSLIQTGSLEIARVRRDGSGGFVVDNNSGSFYNSIDSDYWDDGTGTLNTMSTGDWQVQRVFFNPFTNRCHIYYGQTTYTTFINAKQYLATDPFVEAEYSSHQYVFLGYLIVKGQTNNLADDTNNVIVQSGLFRNTVGSSGGTQTFTHLHDLADVEVADPTNNDLLSYNSSAGLWEHHSFSDLGLATTSSLNGVISGSSQLTSSFDNRYALSGSSTSRVFASDTAPSSPTQGDLWWKSNDGNLYVYYDSYWIVATDTISALPNGLVSGSSQLPTLATTGSNTFTGATIFSSSVTIGPGSGDEGGELTLAKAQTNSTLTGSAVTIDIYQDRLRIFENGGNNRGVYVDLSKTPAGNAGELLWKASGIVNAGTFVTLDNIKATLTSSSNRGLSVAAVSTNFSANISAYHAYSGGIAGISANNQSITTTPTTSLFGWNFPAEADGSYYNILDKTNNRFYRITLMIGASFNNNFISIERLY